MSNLIGRLLTNTEIIASGCWQYTKSDTGRGYCQIGFMGKPIYAHRYSYELFKGRIPEGYEIDHLCRNTKCVNPEHLEAVTPRVNRQRQTGCSDDYCSKGHPLSPDNIYIYPHGGKECKQCRKLNHARSNLLTNQKCNAYFSTKLAVGVEA